MAFPPYPAFPYPMPGLYMGRGGGRGGRGGGRGDYQNWGAAWGAGWDNQVQEPLISWVNNSIYAHE